MTSFEFDALVESTRTTDPDLFEVPAPDPRSAQGTPGHPETADHWESCYACYWPYTTEADHEATVDAIDEYLQHRAAEPTWRRRALDPEAEGVALQWRVGKDLSGYIRAQ
jgi:hypothetical protein